MLRALDELRYGLTLPNVFMSEVKLKNTLDLEIAKHTSVPTIESTGVTALDLEKVDERYLLLGGKNGTLAILDLDGRRNTYPFEATKVREIRPSLQTHIFTVVRAQWYPFDTGLFTSSSKDQNLRIWDANAQRPVDTYKFGYHINTHDMSKVPARHHLIAVATSCPDVKLYDLKGGLSTHVLRGHELGVETVAWSPMDENLLASGGLDGRIFFWDIRSSKGYLKCLDQHNTQQETTAFGSKVIAPRPSPYLAPRRGIKSNLPMAHDTYVTNLKFTDNGLYLASRSVNQEILLWDVALAKNTLVNYGVPIKLIPQFELPFSLEIFCDTKEPVLFNPFHSVINVFDLYTGIKHTSLIGHFRFVNCCVYRSSTQELYSGGNDMNVIAWAPARDNRDENPDANHEEIDLVSDNDEWSDGSG